MLSPILYKTDKNRTVFCLFFFLFSIVNTLSIVYNIDIAREPERRSA